MYLFIILILLIGIIIFLKVKSNNIICLMYHNVFDKETVGIISKKEFEKHMKKIKNLKSYKMEELEKINFKVDKNTILVTFDDGYKNNYTKAYPILKKYGIKATIFLNTKFIEKDEDYLNWKEIQEMYESGLIDFQMHTHSHRLTIRKPEIKGFFDGNEGEFVKREFFSLFQKDGNFKEFKFEGLPIFKTRSQIAISGYKLKKDFLEKYLKVNKEYIKLSFKERKNIWNKELKENKEKYFEKIEKNEFQNIIKYEILKNKEKIEKNLNKKVNFLAYPWGHIYEGNRKDLEKLGVNYFILTSGKVNNRNLNSKKITRINGDAIKEYNKFEKKINKYYKI